MKTLKQILESNFDLKTGINLDLYPKKENNHQHFYSAAKSMSHDEFVKYHQAEEKNKPPPAHDHIPLHHLDPSELETWSDANKEFSTKKKDKVRAMVSHLKGGGKIPPLLVRGHKDDKNFRPQVIDGHHRYLAHHIYDKSKSVPVWYDKHTLSKIWHKAQKE